MMRAMPVSHSPPRLRLLAGEIVDAGAGMGIDDAKRGLLVLQIGEHAHQHDVLDDVGKTAGMKGVTIVHGRGVTTSFEAQCLLLVMPGMSRPSTYVRQDEGRWMPGTSAAQATR